MIRKVDLIRRYLSQLRETWNGQVIMSFVLSNNILMVVTNVCSNLTWVLIRDNWLILNFRSSPSVSLTDLLKTGCSCRLLNFCYALTHKSALFQSMGWFIFRNNSNDYNNYSNFMVFIVSSSRNSIPCILLDN